MSTQGLVIEPGPEPRADMPVMLGDFDIQASGLNAQDMSLASATSVGISTAAALATSGTLAKSGISATSEAGDASLPGWPDWLDWRDINSTSSLIPPELPGNTLTDYLGVDSLNGSPPTMADSSSKVMMTDLIRAEVYERPNT